MRIQPIPFWELRRGDGPIMRIIARREADRERLRGRSLFEIEARSSGRVSGIDGNRRVGSLPTADRQAMSL